MHAHGSAKRKPSMEAELCLPLQKGGVEPKALRYMDLASLTVMRAEHCNVHGLRTNVYKGRCDLRDWEGALDDALSASLSKLDISL